MNKPKSEIIHELYNALSFHEGDISFKSPAPWINNFAAYVCMKMDEPLNSHTFRVIHDFALYMEQHVDAIDKVDFRAFLKNGALIARKAPPSMRLLKDWLATPNTNREYFCETQIDDGDYVTSFLDILIGSYTQWADDVLLHASAFIINME